MRTHPSDEISFLGTSEGLEVSLVPAAGFQLSLIPKVSIPRSLTPALLKVPFQLVKSVKRTIEYLNGVDCAVGFGGYVSGPLYFAAAIKRVPLVIHEQNAKPGWANRLGARFTRFTAISYPVARGALSKAELTGLPLRQDVVEAVRASERDWKSARAQAKREIASELNLDSDRPLIFIFGGSQGSQAINAVIEESLPHFEREEVSVIHGVGRNNALPGVRKNYHPMAYIDQMARIYLAADIVISRSGAVTCAEASALAKYSLFIPLPVGNGEQALNAGALVADGRAEIISQREFTSAWLEKNISRLLVKSAESSDAGDASGVLAVDRILAIIERALQH